MGIRELSKGSQQGSQMPRLTLPKVYLGCYMVGWGWEGDCPQGQHSEAVAQSQREAEARDWGWLWAERECDSEEKCLGGR